MSAALDRRYVAALIAEAERRVRQRSSHTWCPDSPTDRQAAFLAIDAEEALYGGAAGGGKTNALLMAALEHVDRPEYAALLLRRTSPELVQPDGLLTRAHEWLGSSAAKWSEKYMTYSFPSGAVLRFGHMQHEVDRFSYQGGAYHFIGYDELTHFTERQYTYLFSRQRKNVEHGDIPIRMRAATNPGGIGHGWVKRRFIDPGHPERPFVPAKVADNPHLEQASYQRSLERLDSTTYAQLAKGLWIADVTGMVYQYTSANLLPRLPDGLQDDMVIVLSIDAGESATIESSAFAVMGWHPKVPQAVWVLEVWKEADIAGTDYLERIDSVRDRYGSLDSVIMDQSGIGAGYGKEMRKRWRLPIALEPASQRDRRGAQKAFNGALRRGELQVLDPHCGPLLEEWDELHLDERGFAEKPGQINHASDAVLYGWRKCYSWTSEAPEYRPAPGSPEAYRRQEQAEIERERQAYASKQGRPWWQR